MPLRLAQTLTPCLLALALVGAASPASFAQAKPAKASPQAALEKELRELRRDLRAGHRPSRVLGRARRLCLDHAGTPLERLALFGLADLVDTNTPAGKLEALSALRRLSNLGPGPFADATYARVEQLTGWSFAAHPRNLEGDQTALRLDLGKGARPGATYALYRLPADRVHEALVQGARLSEIEGGHLLSRAFANSFEAARTPRHVVSHGILLALPKDAKGTYALAESIDGFRRVTVFSVTSFGMVAHVLGGEVLVYTFDPRTGEPLSLALTLVAQPKPARGEEARGASQPAKVHRGRSDAQGLARFPLPAQGKLICRRGEEVLTCEAASPDPAERELVFISTDRPIYRPGQLVHFKAIYRRLAGTKLAFPQSKAIRVEVRDPLERVVQTRTLEWSAEGTLSGTFQLSDEPAMGEYSVSVAVARYAEDGRFEADLDSEDCWRRSFAVAAYRKPAARISISFASGAKPGSVAIATLKAEYFHGGPVANATVEWSVDEHWEGSSRPGPLLPLSPPFEDPLAWLYADVNGEGEADDFDFDFGYVNERSVLSGTGTTGPDGTLKIAFPTSSKRQDASYHVRANVTDDSRLDSVCEAELQLESAGVRVAVGTSVLFATPGAAIPVRVRVTDPQGAGVAKREVRLSVLYARDASGESVEFEGTESLRAQTDATGLASFSVKAGRDGRMRFVARAADAEGNEASARCGLWVAGPRSVVKERSGGGLTFGDDDEAPWICPACKQDSGIELEECLKCGKGPLRLLPERLPSPEVTLLGQRLAYRPGETARFLVRAPSVPLTCLLTVEGATFHVARVVRLTQTATVLELPVEAAWGPNAFVKLKGWRGHGACGDGFEIAIAPPSELAVRVEADASSYAPGAPLKLRVTTTRQGAPAAAEVELGVVDERVLAILPDTTPDLRTFFRLRREGGSEVRSTTVLVDRVRSLGERNGYGGGGSAGAMLSFDSEEEESGGLEVDERVLKAGFSAKRSAKRTRKRFPDTLLYRAHVRTNAQGVAELTLRGADSLTTWRVQARAVSGPDFAQSQTSFDTRQDVVLRVSTPRFLVEGDRAVVATVVHNRGARGGNFVVALEVAGAKVKLVPGGSAHLRLEAGEEKRVDWEVVAGDSSSATFKAQVTSAVGSDAIESSVEVRALGREHSTSLTGHALGGWSAEVVLSPDADPARASLEVSAASGPLGVIAQALPFLAGFPYGCVEQTMSRFLPAVVASGALERQGVRASERLRADLPKMTAQGLARLYGFQHEDGGWGWWKHDETDEDMTIYVLLGLLSARQAGIKVEERVLEDGLKALRRFEASPAGMLVLALSGEQSEAFKERLQELVPRDDSECALLVLAGRQDLVAKLPVRRPRTSTLDDVVEGALVLRALVHAKAPRERIDAHVEWLIQQRQGPLWNTTLDTAQAVLALSAAAAKAEGQTYRIEVNGKRVPDALIEDGTARLPGSWLRRGKNEVRVSLARGGRARVFGSARLSFRATGSQPRVQTEALALKRFVEVASLDEQGEVEWTALPAGSTVDRRSRLRVRLEVDARREVRYLLLESPLPAGAEGWSGREPEDDEDWWDESWYTRREFRDDRVSIAASELKGRETFTHELRLTHPGSFTLLPARVEGMYEQGSAAESESFELNVTEK